MKISESFRSSFKSLYHNKLRSLLTMLGIIIGISSVIMLTSIGEGIKAQVTSQVESLGANLLYILPGKIEFGPNKGPSKLGVQGEDFNQNKAILTYDDVLTLKGKKNIAAVSGIYNGVDWLNDLKLYVSTTGVDEDFTKIGKLKIRYGRFLNKKELLEKAKVAVIGWEANKELFKSRNSLGKSFQLNGINYRVVGVLKYSKPENMGPNGENINTRIYLPITETIDRKTNNNITRIIAQAASAQTVKPAEKAIRNALLSNHHSMDFSILKQQDMIDVIKNILGIITVSLGGIAAISLLVGGIGIMNIMLVSVAERTREIGIRKAIGASRQDIMLQFLIESILLSVLGGLLGLMLGIGGAKLLSAVFPTIHTATSIPAAIIGLAFSFCIGIFFGVYPASKAAKLDPITALRGE